MTNFSLSCKDESRRDAVRAASLFGLDYIEVDPSQTSLTVFFLGKAPTSVKKTNVIIAGGSRITGIQVTGITVHRQKDPTLNESMDVRVNQPGDFSTYTLSLVKLDANGQPTNQSMDGFDPLFSEVDFTFKGSCPTDLDCLPQKSCPPPQFDQPQINYLAKDYDSFRQLILDRLALIMPGWQESHEPDIGVALVELLAYSGDYLSYYQDAVATEAYLGTALQRISVRRHARLIDYPMHEGCNARAWVTLWTDTDQQFDLGQLYFITVYPLAPAARVITPAALVNIPASSYEVFQPLLPASGTFSIYQAHSEIYFYTWGNARCCLAPGATSATLVDQWVATSASSVKGKKTAAAIPDGPHGTVRALHLNVGDVLIFEEVVGPKTGNPADANPKHRQAVRLTSVTPTVDPLYPFANTDFKQPLVNIEWSAEDALTFPLCLSAQLPPPVCSPLQNVSVARGNVLMVDHAASTSEILGTVPTESTTANCPSPCHPALIEIAPGKFRPVLTQSSLTFSQPLPAASCSASTVIAQNPRQALPNITLSSIPPAPADSSCIPPLFAFDNLNAPTSLALRIKQRTDLPAQYLSTLLSASTRTLLADWNGIDPLPVNTAAALTADLNALLERWMPAGDLRESGANDSSFVVEMDNGGLGHLRFGDVRLGRQPDAGMSFRASYRIGNGTAGNVGAGTISYLVLRNQTLSGVSILPRNPLPATGGVAHEPIAEVKLFAPHAIQDVIERAITADDYAQLATDNARRMQQRPARARCSAQFVPLQGAKATLRWTGSWYETLVAIDPMNTEQAPAELTSEIRSYLESYRRIGHDLTVEGAHYVPLDLAISVCLLPDYLRAHVEEALLQVFSNRVLPDGSYGFFHPNNQTFSGNIYISKIVAAAQAVTGVASVTVTRLQRYIVDAHPYPLHYGIAGGAVPPLGVLPLGPFEIAQLDNDPSFPENGRLEIKMRGGR
jgi:hypothetical protein